MKLVLAGMLSLVLASTADAPKLQTRVFPQMSLTGSNGCSTVIMTAEIKGVEDEEWYCPKVEWELPDGTTATEESDCAPFEKRNQCAEDQTGCGLTGFYWDPIKKAYVDKVKECPCTITGYPRIWRRRLCAPAHPKGERWEVWVRLSKRGKTLSRQPIHFWVKG